MVLSKKKNVKLDDRYVSIRVDQTSSHRSGAETFNFAEMCPNPPYLHSPHSSSLHTLQLTVDGAPIG